MLTNSDIENNSNEEFVRDQVVSLEEQNVSNYNEEKDSTSIEEDREVGQFDQQFAEFDFPSKNETVRKDIATIGEKDLVEEYDNISLLNNIDNKTFSCSICGETFDFKTNLFKHMRCHVDDDYMNNINSFRCSVCNDKFDSKLNLFTHMACHLDDIMKNFDVPLRECQCSVCKKIQYFRSTHPPLKCVVCSKEFAEKVHLRNHMKIHIENKQFQCMVCNKKFVLRQYLLQHSLVHFNVTCIICNKKFKNTTELVPHLERHEEIANYECLICNKIFYLKNRLTNHMKSHKVYTGYQCTICGKVYKLEHRLQIHMTYHTDVQCKLCNAVMSNRKSLTGHMKTHVGKKFQCPICLRKFAQKYYLKSHLKHKHSGGTKVRKKIENPQL